MMDLRREASLNWLALGILLAAWNATDDDAAPARKRPEEFSRYACVTVRAVTLHAEYLCKSHKSVNVL